MSHCFYRIRNGVNDLILFKEQNVAIATGTSVHVLSGLNARSNSVVDFGSEVTSVRAWGKDLLVGVYTLKANPWLYFMSSLGMRKFEIGLECDDFGVCGEYLAARTGDEVSILKLSETGELSTVKTMSVFPNGIFSDYHAAYLCLHGSTIRKYDLKSGVVYSLKLNFHPESMTLDSSSQYFALERQDSLEVHSVDDLTWIARLTEKKETIRCWEGDAAKKCLCYSTSDGIFRLDFSSAQNHIITAKTTYCLRIVASTRQVLVEHGVEEGGSVLWLYEL